MSENELPFFARLWFAWVCFFRVLFDARFAARVWGAREPAALPPPKSPEPEPAKAESTAPDPNGAALALLALFQREGRLVDFLEQDMGSFDDAEIGAAARVVHEGCRKALRAHVKLESVRKEEEGERVKLESGFDPSGVKLSGNVSGKAPYEGVLRHRGWRAKELVLPTSVKGHDPSVLAPAEVEL